jgi:hypothetical protein
VAVLLAAAPTAAAGGGAAAGTRFKPCSERFAYYSLGERFEGAGHGRRIRRCDRPYPGEPTRANYHSFVYDRCQSGCDPSVSVQTWPACERHAHSYDPPPGTDDGFEVQHGRMFSLRGARARFYEHGSRLEVYTGEVTVVLFGDGRSQLRRAARALRTPRGVRPRVRRYPARLPAPTEKALSGLLRC